MDDLVILDQEDELNINLEEDEETPINLESGIAIIGGSSDIESISVDGVIVEPDENKNVNIDLSNKLDKPKNFISVGLMNYDSTTGEITKQGIYQSVPGANQIPLAKNGGRITTNTPTEDLDCTNKDYVDKALNTKVEKVTDTHGFNRVYGVHNGQLDTTMYNIMAPIQFNNENDASRREGLAYYTQGRLGCYTPQGDYEATNKKYVDTKVADLVNSAPETLDTLGELAQAIKDNEDVVEALNSAIGNKASTEYVDNLVGDINTALESILGV